MKAGDELDFRYRLYWERAAAGPFAAGAGIGHAYRNGRFPEGWAPGEHYRINGPVVLLSILSAAT